MLKRFAENYPGIVLGLSDHTSGHVTTLGAIALGARVIEKHFTDNNNQEGPDHAFAMNPETWRIMVDRSYELLSALGDGVKRVEPNERQSQIVQRRCIRVKNKLEKGSVINEKDLIYLRPISENGMHPYEKDLFIGKKLLVDIEAGEHLTIKMI